MSQKLPLPACSGANRSAHDIPAVDGLLVSRAIPGRRREPVRQSRVRATRKNYATVSQGPAGDGPPSRKDPRADGALSVVEA